MEIVNDQASSEIRRSGKTQAKKIVAQYGGGIENYGTSAKLSVSSSTLSGNSAGISGGGIDNYNGELFVGGTSQITNNQATTGYGGGIFSSSSTVTFDGTGVAVKSNKAHLPVSESIWYQGWGVDLYPGTPTITGGFNPATQVTGNTHI